MADGDLQKRIDLFPSTARQFGLNLYSSLVQRYEAFKSVRPRDWDFFSRVAMVFLANAGASAHLTEGDYAVLSRRYDEAVTKLFTPSDIEGSASRSSATEIDQALDRLESHYRQAVEWAESLPEEERKAALEYAVGFWVLTNSLQSGDVPDGSRELTQAIGSLLMQEFFRYFDLYR